MTFRHIVAAADDSAEGRVAILTAGQVAARSGARVTVLTVAETAGDGGWSPVLEHLGQVVDRQLAPLPNRPAVSLAAVAGLPGVEIDRFAESSNADLIVLGRKTRTPAQRMLVGDTADSVARRARIACLFVPAWCSSFQNVCAALDGTARGLVVLKAAIDFASATGSTLHAITVEPETLDGITEGLPPTGKSLRLLQAIEQAMAAEHIGHGAWGVSPGSGGSPLTIAHGPILGSVLAELERSKADLLVIGHRRGGPPGVIEAGSISRRLAHEAVCAVMTVPI
jgi:nucleotide-binding universal stress UspA family protein